MNYLKIYNQIIDRAKNRDLVGYSEKHHIIPKCMGGTNDKTNLVKLTAREHLLCHLLLAKTYKVSKLWAAVNRMTNFGERNSKKYEQYRRYYAKTICGSGNPRFKAVVTPYTKSLISKGNLGKKRDSQTRYKMGSGTRGKKRTPDECLRYVESKGGKAFKVYKLINIKSRQINIKDLAKEYIGTFQSTRECARFLNIPHQNIGQALKGKARHVKGYVFESILWI